MNAQTSNWRVSSISDVRINHESLRKFVANIFVTAGLAPDEANIEAEVLVWANLRGIDSHGVLLTGEYARGADDGIESANHSKRCFAWGR